ncbi:hypothetical protein VNO78_32498 [Psophocarpus tetragonolobus]|uniref:Uncharacterized protein n=1 Tax=Psophocarpus tetragonolobus TaxID=3891 RepID=A0AAN9NWX2_PSOTE
MLECLENLNKRNGWQEVPITQGPFCQAQAETYGEMKIVSRSIMVVAGSFREGQYLWVLAKSIGTSSLVPNEIIMWKLAEMEDPDRKMADLSGFGDGVGLQI